MSRGGERDGGLVQPAVFRLGDLPLNGVEPDPKPVEKQARAWREVQDRVSALPPALVEVERQTVDLDGAARDLGFTFASAFEDAIVAGEDLSDILEGLEDDILRILARTLITEPLAAGIQGAIGTFTGGGLGRGGGLEGAILGGAGVVADLFPSPVAGVGLGTFNAIDPIAERDVGSAALEGLFGSLTGAGQEVTAALSGLGGGLIASGVPEGLALAA